MIIDLPESNIKKVETFKVNPVKKPEKPEYILLDSEYNPTDKSNAKYFAFTPEEFAKIVGLSKSFEAQSDILKEYNELLNLRTEQLNVMIDLIHSKETLNQHLYTMYKLEHELRLTEKQNYVITDIMNKVFIVIQAGVIVALGLAL
jgi:hypothetical protein